MKNNDILILKNDKDQEIQVEVLFTYVSKDEDKNFIVYTDHSKDSDGKEKVYAGIYDEKESMLNPVVEKEDYDMIENILSSIENKNN